MDSLLTNLTSDVTVVFDLEVSNQHLKVLLCTNAVIVELFTESLPNICGLNANDSQYGQGQRILFRLC